MKSRALRFALQCAVRGAPNAAAYVVWQKESEGLQGGERFATHFDERARVVIRSFLEIKSAEPGYVAAGQGERLLGITR